MSFSRLLPLILGTLIPLLSSSCDGAFKKSKDTGIPDQTAGGFLVEFDTSIAYSSITSFTDSLRESNSCDSAYVESINWNRNSATLPLFLYRTYYLSFGDCMRQKKKLISILSALRDSASVVNVEVDAVVKASSSRIYNQAYQLEEIKRNQACSSIDNDADPVVVAVIDTGVDKNHPDLSGAFYRDSSGRVIGANFLGKGTKGAPDDNWQDQNGHGTHVSGIIAGTGTTDPGVASCANVKVMPIKALGAKGTGVSIEINRAIQWAGENGADIINLSLGHLNSVSEVPAKFESSLFSYLKDKGVLVFAAAGNDGIQNGSTLKSGKFVYSFPASYDSVISVAATGKDGKLASFSNYGKLIDIAAPGEKIVATKLGGGYKSMSGTSMATPVAAASYGLALLNLKSRLRQKPSSYKVGYDRALPLLKASISSRSLDSSQVSIKRYFLQLLT